MSYDDQGQPANNDPYSYQDPSQYDPSQGYTGYESGSNENQGYDNSGYAPTPPPQEQQPVRPQLQQLQRIPSGIPGFDQIVGGGLIRDRVYLLGGPAGAGKTIFSTQFLYNGISKYNENGIYVVLEETPQQLRENMYNSFGWNIQTYEDNGNIICCTSTFHARIAPIRDPKRYTNRKRSQSRHRLTRRNESRTDPSRSQKPHTETYHDSQILRMHHSAG